VLSGHPDHVFRPHHRQPVRDHQLRLELPLCTRPGCADRGGNLRDGRGVRPRPADHDDDQHRDDHHRTVWLRQSPVLRRNDVPGRIGLQRWLLHLLRLAGRSVLQRSACLHQRSDDAVPGRHLRPELVHRPAPRASAMSFAAKLAVRSADVYADFLMPYVTGESNVLDVGCGSGTISIGRGRGRSHGASASRRAEAGVPEPRAAAPPPPRAPRCAGRGRPASQLPQRPRSAAGCAAGN